MDFNDLYEVGGDIMEAVDDAVRTNDYTKLSDSIRKTVVDVTEAMKRDVRDSRRDYAGGQDVRRRYYRSAAGQGGRPEDDPDVYRRYRSSARRAARQAAVRSAGQQAAENKRKVSGARSFFFQKKS